ncbi:unnamed protein product [Closterium sp. NIES-64]|nr:unnamed protein product [Closterium sp. NIES-64]
MLRPALPPAHTTARKQTRAAVLPTFTTSLATTTLFGSEETAAVSVASWQKRGKGGRKGGKGGGGVVVVVVVEVVAAVVVQVVVEVVASLVVQVVAAVLVRLVEAGNARGTGLAGTTTGGVWPVAWYTAQQRQQSQQQQPQQGQQQQGPGGSGALDVALVCPVGRCVVLLLLPAPYVVRTGSHQGQPCGRLHPLGQCFAQLTDRLRAEYGFGPAPDWAPLVYSRGPSLFQMTAVELLDAL